MKYEYILIKTKNRRKTTSLTIDDNRQIVVRAPFHAKESDIDKFVSKNFNWIQKTLKKIVKPDKSKYIEKAIYRGREYAIKHIKASSNIYKLQFNGEIFELLAPANVSTRERKEIFESWYIKQAKKLIPSTVEKQARIMNLKYNGIKVKKVNTIWGSCSSKQNLNFNLKLVLAPKKVLEYVVIHELAHLKHFDHSPKFWKLVQKYSPNYKRHKEWLNNNRHLLSI